MEKVNSDYQKVVFREGALKDNGLVFPDPTPEDLSSYISLPFVINSNCEKLDYSKVCSGDQQLFNKIEDSLTSLIRGYRYISMADEMILRELPRMESSFTRRALWVMRANMFEELIESPYVRFDPSRQEMYHAQAAFSYLHHDLEQQFKTPYSVGKLTEHLDHFAWNPLFDK